MPLKPIEDLRPQGRAKRAQIVEAARQLFLARGFERTSMDAIRDAAGVSKATLYTHYANKEALFSDVVREIVDRIAGDWLPNAADAAVDLHTPEDLRRALAALAQRSFATLMRPEYLALVRIVIADVHQFPQLGEIYRAAGPEPGLRRVAGFLAAARARGLADVADPDAAARLLMGTILSYALIDGLLTPDAPTVPAAAQVEAVVDLFIRAIAPR